MKQKAIIVDLEGTLTDCSHRIHHYNNKDYDKWNEGFKDDPPNTEFIKYLNKYHKNNPDVKILLVTAKSFDHCDIIGDWLIENRIHDLIDYWYFRKVFDVRTSVAVKRDRLHEIQEDYDVLYAYDDRDDIIAMFEEEGVHTIQIGIIKPKSKPKSKPVTPDKILKDSAKLFKQRNKEHGNGYKDFGKIMMALFPDGIKIKNQKDAARFGILNIMIAKIDRYCKNFNKGGQKDSLKDLSVYSAMLLEVDDEL